MSNLLTEWENLPADLRNSIMKEITTGHKMEMWRAEQNQKRVAKDNQRERKSVDGLGRHVASIDLGGYLGNMITKNESVRDREYLEWVMKRHPEVRVNSKGTKTQVGYSG